MLGLSVPKLSDCLAACPEFQAVGKLRGAQGVLTASLDAGLGELVQIQTAGGPPVLAEVIGFRDGRTQLLPFEPCDRLRSGLIVQGLGRRMSVSVGDGLLGRIIDGLGRPIDGLGPLEARGRAVVSNATPSPLDRPRITKPLETGVKVVDSLLTFGLGQRIALMAGSGVGKSTLLGEFAKSSSADVNVVALIGERGREVKPFIDDCLGREGLRRSVVIVATADQQPLMRLRAADAAMAIANRFRSEGQNVLFMLDSITRLATSQREIGLLLGEPPTVRGYTPSVFHRMSALLEQMGSSGDGSISGVISVLVDGDDLDEPISDSVRSVADGHIVLDRELAQHGHYPAINISKSLSRVFRDVTDEAHQKAAISVRDVLATYAEVADLLRVGAYTKGISNKIDQAIHLKAAIDEFVKQPTDAPSPFGETKQRLLQIAAQWSAA